MLDLTIKLMRNVIGPQNGALSPRPANTPRNDGSDQGKGGSDPKIDALRELIADLQEQLRQARAELRRAKNGRQDDASQLRAQNAMARINVLNASLQMAYGQMLAALRKGGASGTLLDTRA